MKLMKKIIYLCLAMMCLGCDEPSMIVLMGSGGNSCAKCTAEQTCENGECKDKVDDPCAKCSGEQTCEDGVCKDKPVEEPCDNKCTENQICVDGVCKDIIINPCDNKCAENQTCVNSKCVDNVGQCTGDNCNNGCKCAEGKECDGKGNCIRLACNCSNGCNEDGSCVPDEPATCPDGQTKGADGNCVPDEPVTCPDGQMIGEGGKCECSPGKHVGANGECEADEPSTCPTDEEGACTCSSDSDCMDGMVCYYRECVEAKCASNEEISRLVDGEWKEEKCDNRCAIDTQGRAVCVKDDSCVDGQAGFIRCAGGGKGLRICNGGIWDNGGGCKGNSCSYIYDDINHLNTVACSKGISNFPTQITYICDENVVKYCILGGKYCYKLIDCFDKSCEIGDSLLCVDWDGQ